MDARTRMPKNLALAPVITFERIIHVGPDTPSHGLHMVAAMYQIRKTVDSRKAGPPEKLGNSSHKVVSRAILAILQSQAAAAAAVAARDLQVPAPLQPLNQLVAHAPLDMPNVVAATGMDPNVASLGPRANFQMNGTRSVCRECNGVSRRTQIGFEELVVWKLGILGNHLSALGMTIYYEESEQHQLTNS
jgi:hypothetical protein